MTIYTADGERATVFNQVRAFFNRNPDECLTREDIMVKFDCGYGMAKKVVERLILVGLAPEQFPRGPKPPRAKGMRAAPLPFPDCLSPGERTAVEAYMTHGGIKAAADRTGKNLGSLSDQLKDARRKAGARSTAELAVLYTRAMM